MPVQQEVDPFEVESVEVDPSEVEETAPPGIASQLWQGAKASARGLAETLNPLPMLGGLVRHPLQTVQGVLQAQGAEGSKAVQALREGRYSEAAGHGLAYGLPLLGPAAAKAGEDIGAGKLAEGAGETAGLLLPFGLHAAGVGGAKTAPLGEIAKPGQELPPAIAPEQATAEAGAHKTLVQALKPPKRSFQFEDSLKRAVPEIAHEAALKGEPLTSVQHVVDHISSAKSRVWQQYEKFLGPGQAANGMIDGAAIADAIEGTISKRIAQENPALARAIKTRAAGYRRMIPLSEAEEFLQSANNELDTFYKKEKVGRDVAAKDPSTAPTLATADALRKGIYAKLDTLSGPGAAEVKKTYGALTAVENVARPRAIEIARKNPTTLAEQLNIPAAARDVAIGTLMGHPLPGVAAGVARAGVGTYMKFRSSPDQLVTRAFKTLGSKRSQLPEPTGPAGPSTSIQPAPPQIPAPPRLTQTAYRARDVGELGIPATDVPAHATMSLEEARAYAEHRGEMTGKPQEVIQVDLSGLSPQHYTSLPGPRGSAWVKFHKALPESAIRKLR